MKKILVGILLFAILGGIAGLFALKVEGVQSARHENAPRTAIGISANGLVEGTRPESALRAEVTGILLAVHVRENQDVKKGSLLAELHNEIQLHQVALAQAELDLARAQRDRLSNGEQSEKRRSMAALEAAKQAMYDQFKLEAERSTKLANQGAASREQAERDQFKLRQASADLEQARADRALVEAPARVDEMAAARARVAAAESRLRLAEAELAKTRLRAPSNGRILQLFAEPGETAGPTSPQPVLLLADLSKRHVRAFVEELDATRVRPGQKAMVRTDSLPGKEWKGVVSLVVPRMGKRAPQSDVPGEYKDLYFREALIELAEADDLPLNLRVQARIEVESEGGR